MLRGAIHRLSRSHALRGFVALLERFDRRRPNLLRVLTYHRVNHRTACPELDVGLISATPESFADQVKYVSDHYQPVSIAQVLAAVRRVEPLPPRAVHFTFDDAYRDFAEHAWPILQQHRVPVTLFVPTGYPDQPQQTFWWDRLHQVLRHCTKHSSITTPLGRMPLESARDRDHSFQRLKNWVKSLPHAAAMTSVDELTAQMGSPAPLHYVLGWADLRRLAGEGVSLGTHTRTHPLLNRIAPAEVAAEALGARRDIAAQIGSSLPIFAYPGGALSDGVVKVLDEAGFELAFTTTRGINDLNRADRLRLRRINVGTRTTGPVLRAQLLPWSVHLQQ